jgi:hypothetical protein
MSIFASCESLQNIFDFKTKFLLYLHDKIMNVGLLHIKYLNGIENHYLFIEGCENLSSDYLQLLCLEYAKDLGKEVNIFIFKDKESYKINLAYPNQTQDEIIQLSENLVFLFDTEFGFEEFPMLKDKEYLESVK